MKLRSSCLYLVFLTLLTVTCNLHATVIRQAPTARFVAWEGEDVYSITNGDPALTATWVIKDDAPASGGKSLYQQGPNQQTAYAQSFAYYHIQFKTPGLYNLYIRWRADKARSDQDANGGNSYQAPNSFGNLTTDTANANFHTSAANNTRVPPDANNFLAFRETSTYEVTQADIDAGGELILKIGTREWGMFLDRFVLSLDADITDSAFNSLPNSPTSLIVQGANDSFLAWEGENVNEIRNGDPAATATWVAKTDAPAAEGAALYQQGPNQQTAYAQSFALYTLKFKTPGVYNLYIRWRADKARSDQDANGGNSYQEPNTFGDLTTDTANANFHTASANNTRVPPDANNYLSFRENQTYEITQADIDSGNPVIFKIVGSSRVDLQACKLEYSIVSPK